MKTLKEVQCQKMVPIHFNFRESEIGAILVNPLREKIQTRMVAWSLVVMFSFLQIVPTGWAATRPVPVDELQGQSVPVSVDALANAPTSPKPAPAPQQAIGFVDSTAFQLNDKPLSPVTATVTPAPATVTNPIEKVMVGPSPRTNPIEKVVIGSTIEPIHIGPSPVFPPAVQANVDELKKALGKDFSVNAILQADGTFLVTAKWLVTVCDDNGICGTRSGRSGLTEMKYNLSSDGILNKDSLKTTFWFDQTGQTFHPNAKLLLDGMKLVKEGMSDMETLAFLASQITVMKVAANGAVTIRLPGQMYFKVYRDEEGVLQVEMYVELPPAVKSYVDALKAKFGVGYDVTAMLRRDGTFLVRVERSNACSGAGDVGCLEQNAGPRGTFRSMKFSVSKDGSVSWDSIKAYYNGVEVDGKLLLDSMGALEASFHPVSSKWMPPASMYIAR